MHILQTHHPTQLQSSSLEKGNGLLLRHLDLALVNSLDDVVRGFTVDGASDGLACTQNFLDASGEVLGEGLVRELSGDLGLATSDRASVAGGRECEWSSLNAGAMVPGKWAGVVLGEIDRSIVALCCLKWWTSLTS